MHKGKPPVTEGQTFEVHIHGYSHAGDGVGKYEGFTVFVRGAVKGETVLAKITKLKPTFAQAQLVKTVDESAERAEPRCPLFHRCGGCQLQHLTYDAQLAYKEQLVRDSLERIGKLGDVHVAPTIGMAEPWRYRNKAQVPVGVQHGKPAVGFYRRETHQIVDVERCYIQHTLTDDVIKEMKHMIQSIGVPPYRPQTHRGVLRHVVTKVGVHTGELMIILVTNGPSLPHKSSIIKHLRDKFPQLISLVQNINDKRTNVVLGKENRTLWGSDVITDRIGDIRFVISPLSFFQVNTAQTEVLYNEVLRMAELTGDEVVVDAYCGIGTIALYLARQAKRVYGVELVEEAIEDAWKNAQLNGIHNVEFTAGRAEKVMPQWLEQGIHPDVIVVDPPRKGCDERLLKTISRMQPKRIIYVSCNPSTLARDLRYLVDNGFTVNSVQPVDMFPNTAHVECVVLMSRVEK